MPLERWSPAQALALAPDASSQRAGRALSGPAAWVSAGADDEGLWGEARGSGRNPYQVCVDPAGPAYRCSCPSRKFPCKHVVGLLLRWSDAGLPEAAAPPWAREWRERRAAAPKPAAKAAAAPDPAAVAKRAERRAERVAGGMAELRRWLDDQVRHGLAAAEQTGPRPYEAMAARLVDAQAPGAAGAVRRLARLPGSGAHWADRLLGELGLLRLLAAGHERLEQLPGDLAATVRTRIGFPVASEDVLAGPAVHDRWQVLGRTEIIDDALTTRRTWLRGAGTGRFALILSFAAPGRSLPTDPPPGTELTAGLHYHPGAWPQRALLGAVEATGAMTAPAGGSVADALRERAAALAADPWRDLVPVVLAGVVPTADGHLADAAGDALPLVTDTPWWLLAAAGGHPATVAAELGRDGLRPLSAWAEGAFVTAPDTYAGGGPRTAELPPELLSAALVGTDRRPWPGGAVPHVGSHPGTPAGLLEAAAAAAVHARAGRPAGTGHPAVAPAPAETTRPLPPAAAARAARILADGGIPGGGHAQGEILAEWLAAVPADRHVPPGVLPALLDAGRRATALRPDIARVAGRRGRWLAAQSPAWAYLLDEAAAAGAGDDAWLTGTVGERAAHLERLRRRDPAAGRELLAAHFAAESAHDRARFLEALATGLSLADDAFLEDALDDRRREVRQAAADLLRTLPGSGYQHRMAARVAAWVRVERRLLGRDRLVAEPPAAVGPDLRRDGVEPRAPRGTSPSAALLTDVVGAAGLAVWADRFRLTPQAAVALPVLDDLGPALLHGWAVAAARERDAAWAGALVPALLERPRDAADRQLLWALFELLPPDRAAELAAAEFRRDPSLSGDLLTAYRGRWPAGLAEAVLRVVEGRARTDEQAWQLGHLCRQVATTMPPAAHTAARALADRLATAGVGDARLRPVAQLAAVLTFRHDMHEELR
ncbi:SWIM zinc finger family protein [Spirilliplanes yamanashiensis]|uniref:SWIM-type domain-containing protein n=1 Tax=Spirilliplanes yamanashiensis TaxID=42233 RepID=A0A8J4DLA9_9ACTN|nr:SWIM zinc finger family protein [Spirilliplanes yamanashiensis]MDP9818065.1 hypothetical protein [Spirilliplanes yamanashiensis]GIJ04875.1 hypothetical protein Sya03_42270 [Spirilliplanes yamanashiensis]